MSKERETVTLKAELRKEFRKRRSSVAQPEECAVLAAHNLQGSSFWKSARTVLLYSSVGSELNTAEIIRIAHSEKKEIRLPVTLNTDGDMCTGYLKEDTTLTVGNFAIEEPKPDSLFDLSQIDLVLVPGIAFDRTGGRLGQGKGYYDRFLNRLNATLVGFCFSDQISEKPLPMDDHDHRIDLLVTEKGIIECSG